MRFLIYFLFLLPISELIAAERKLIPVDEKLREAERGQKRDIKGRDNEMKKLKYKIKSTELMLEKMARVELIRGKKRLALAKKGMGFFMDALERTNSLERNEKNEIVQYDPVRVERVVKAFEKRMHTMEEKGTNGIGHLPTEMELSESGECTHTMNMAVQLGQLGQNVYETKRRRVKRASSPDIEHLDINYSPHPGCLADDASELSCDDLSFISNIIEFGKD